MSTLNPHDGQKAAILLIRTYVLAAVGGRWPGWSHPGGKGGVPSPRRPSVVGGVFGMIGASDDPETRLSIGHKRCINLP
jgi:hypothetical protein